MPRPYHTGRFNPLASAPQPETRLPPAEFTDPAYPGDAVLRADLVRDNVIGDVRVQWYGDKALRVGSFLPGVVIDLPGDTPKIEPERSEWAATREAAAREYVWQLVRALRDGWRLEREWRPCDRCTDPMDCGSWRSCHNKGFVNQGRGRPLTGSPRSA